MPSNAGGITYQLADALTRGLGLVWVSSILCWACARDFANNQCRSAAAETGTRTDFAAGRVCGCPGHQSRAVAEVGEVRRWWAG